MTVLAADWVMIGTTSPTCSRAIWLLSTSRRGVEITLVWVTFDSMSRIARGAKLPATQDRLKPGTAGTIVATLLVVSSVLVLPALI